MSIALGLDFEITCVHIGLVLSFPHHRQPSGPNVHASASIFFIDSANLVFVKSNWISASLCRSSDICLYLPVSSVGSTLEYSSLTKCHVISISGITSLAISSHFRLGYSL